ncbi:MAG: NUDIX domain-containing protein [Tenericutes bacterium]|nr:NUDIX domain-containing protein [Mycoplasmatota bacterium]
MKETRFYYKDNSAPKPNKPNHIGTSIIIKYNNMILLEQRSDSNRWAIIGGGLKIKESLIDCAIRETLEETGINIAEDEIHFFKIYDDPSRIASYPDGNVLRVITVVYETVLDQLPDLICSSESKKNEFFSIDEIREIEIAETHKPIIEDYFMIDNCS